MTKLHFIVTGFKVVFVVWNGAAYADSDIVLSLTFTSWPSDLIFPQKQTMPKDLKNKLDRLNGLRQFLIYILT